MSLTKTIARELKESKELGALSPIQIQNIANKVSAAVATAPLTVTQAAAFVGVNPQTIRRWIHSGALRAANISGNGKGSSYRIPLATLEDFRQKLANPTQASA